MRDFLIKRYIDPELDPSGRREACGRLAAWTGLVLNCLLAAMKIWAGVYYQRLSILGDGMEHLFDIACALLTLLAFRITEKPADEEHPYGHARFEYIASGLIALGILWAGGSLLTESFSQIGKAKEYGLESWMLIILAVSIVIKLWMAMFYRSLGMLSSSDILKTSAADSSMDALETFVILTGLMLAPILQKSNDAVLGAVVACLGVWNALKILKEMASRLLGEAPSAARVDEIEMLILGHPEVLGVHKIMVHDYGQDVAFCTAHCEVDPAMDPVAAHEVIHEIEAELESRLALHATLHTDAHRIEAEASEVKKERMEKILREIDPGLEMTGLLADPPRMLLSLKLTEAPASLAVLRKKIQKAAESSFPDWHLLIRITLPDD